MRVVTRTGGLVAAVALIAVAIGCLAAERTLQTAAFWREHLVPVDSLGVPVEVIITEIEVNPEGSDLDPGLEDWVELCNTGSMVVQLDGWIVEAEVWSLSQWGGLRWSDPIPQGTELQPGECYVVRRSSRWMTSETTHAVRLYAMLRVAETGEQVIAMIDEAVWGNPIVDNPYAFFSDTKSDIHTHQRCSLEGYPGWVFAPETPGSPGCLDQP